MRPLIRLLRPLLVGALAAAAVSAPVTALDSSYGSISCTVTPRKPVLGAGSVTASFVVSCNKTANIKVEIAVGEWDGTVFELPPTRDVALSPKVVSIAASTTARTFTTTPKVCWNSEVGGEEYGTRIRVYIGGTTWSAYERTTSTTDAYSC